MLSHKVKEILQLFFNLFLVRLKCIFAFYIMIQAVRAEGETEGGIGALIFLYSLFSQQVDKNFGTRKEKGPKQKLA